MGEVEETKQKRHRKDTYIFYPQIKTTAAMGHEQREVENQINN